MELIDKTIQYDSLGRIKYHPKYHTKHRKPFTKDDLIYICKYWEFDNVKDLSFALGKTEMTLASKISELKKKGQYELYKNWEES
jgi:hypothetical protein